MKEMMMMIMKKLEKMEYKMYEMIFGKMLPDPHHVKVAMKVSDKSLFFDPFDYKVEWTVESPPAENYWSSPDEVEIMPLSEFLMRDDTVLPKYIALNEMYEPYMCPYVE